MEVPRSYPFEKLDVPPEERALWWASNPTFHRGSDYGIVLTNRALYLRSWLFSFSRWKRVALADIRGARFKNSSLFPCLELVTSRGTTSFRTPHDFYRDEMDFDRKNLIQAACLVEHLRAAPNNSSKPTPLRGAA